MAGAAPERIRHAGMAGEARSPERRPQRSRRSRWMRVVVTTAVILVAGRFLFDYATRIAPPQLPPPVAEAVRFDGTTAWVGPASLERRGALWVMRVAGDPVELGYRHARLTAPLMAAGDLRMLELFSTFVPSAALRWILTGIVRARYRGVDRGFPADRRAEIYGESVGYGDRGPPFLPTYHRLVYLHALYDIALAFERSPLVGCTAFVASGAATAGGAAAGHTIVGRNFDLDIDPWFDVEKAVQIYAPKDRLAFASIAWPGMTGVVTGMNEAGIWVSVNGARAGNPDDHGVPVVFTTRAILEQAHSLDEAIAIATHDAPMASHMLLLADGTSGESATIERAGGRAPAVRRSHDVMVVANHYGTESFAADPKDAYVREHTSTLAREARIRELVARDAGRIDPGVAAAILRDRRGLGDTRLPLGNRNAVDSLIATHSVVADLTAGVLWVSEGPHTLGSYRRIDVRARLVGTATRAEEASGDLPAEPLLTDGGYQGYALGARLRRMAARDGRRGDVTAAAEGYERAIALREDDHLAWRALADVRDRAGDRENARLAWRRVVALAPESPAAEAEARRAAGE